MLRGQKGMMTSHLRSLILLLTVCYLISIVQCSRSQREGILVGAFNVQTFGPTKYGNETLMHYIIQIIRRYDVVLIQEIRDASGVLIPGVLSRLKAGGETWDVRYSERLGRSSYKEQYAYYFRSDKLAALSEFQYDDGPDDGSDVFSREPYGVLFESVNGPGIAVFGTLGIHTSPTSANQELNGLDEAYYEAADFWNTENILIMGDFNADCSYMNAGELDNLGIRQQGFEWLIGDEVDTTQGQTHCAYDRLVAAGSQLIDAVDSATAQPYEFDEVFQLDYDLARKVSDHYPVEVVLKPTARNGRKPG